MLAGHTHGGQVTLARLHEIALGRIAGHKYVHGLYGSRTPKGSNAPQGAVYVGAGIGAAVMPLRLGERGKRELTIFELGHAPGTFDEHHAEQAALCWAASPRRGSSRSATPRSPASARRGPGTDPRGRDQAADLDEDLDLDQDLDQDQSGPVHVHADRPVPVQAPEAPG